MFEKLKNKSVRKWRTPIIFLVSSILLTLFLFFIDEGNYSFNWIRSFYALIIAFIYALPMFLIQFLIFKSLSKKFSTKEKYLISIPFGLIIGTMLVVFVFNMIK